MSTDGQGAKWRRNIVDNFNRRVWRTNVTDRQTTDGRATAYSEREHEFNIGRIYIRSTAMRPNNDSFKLLILSLWSASTNCLVASVKLSTVGSRAFAIVAPHTWIMEWTA